MSARKWNIIYFKSSQGNFPVYDFINSLEAKAKAKIIRSIDLLEEYGIRLGLPHVKKLTGTDLWELRVLGRDNIRIFYIATSGRSFLLLLGFIKKSKKSSKKEIKTAHSRLKEYKQQNI